MLEAKVLLNLQQTLDYEVLFLKTDGITSSEKMISLPNASTSAVKSIVIETAAEGKWS
jgi:hypothetical protein